MKRGVGFQHDTGDVSRRMTTQLCCSPSIMTEIDTEQPTSSDSFDTLLGCGSPRLTPGVRCQTPPTRMEEHPVEEPVDNDAVHGWGHV